MIVLSGASLVLFAVDAAGLAKDVALITDGQLSGLCLKGLTIAEVAPEGAVGGPIAVYESGGQQHIAFVMNHHVWAFKLGGTIPERPAPPPLPITDEWDGRIEDVSAIKLGVENVTNIRNANREEQWSNPWAVTPQRGRTKADQHLTRPGDRGLDVPQLQHVRVTVPLLHQGLHYVSSSSGYWKTASSGAPNTRAIRNAISRDGE